MGQILLITQESSIIFTISGILQLDSLESPGEFIIKSFDDSKEFTRWFSMLFGTLCLVSVAYQACLAVFVIFKDDEFL
jgi:hypothetical protein